MHGFRFFSCEGSDLQAVKLVNGHLPVVRSAGTRVALPFLLGLRLERENKTTSLYLFTNGHVCVLLWLTARFRLCGNNPLLGS